MERNLIAVIELLVNFISLALFINVILSWVLDPWHEARQFMDRIVAPIVQPVRNLMPPMGGVDFSVMIAAIAVQLMGQLLIAIIRASF